jgi:hypothetical protein
VLRGERADVTDFFSRDLGGWGPWSSIIC